jgi:hypothetical protein
MRIAYAILVHRNPEQVARLVWALAGPEVIFCIHVDRAGSEAPFKKRLIDRANVHFVDRRVRVLLFSYRLVEATLRCFELALSKGADVIVLLSGQDYPLRPVTEIRDFFERHPGKQFVDHSPITPLFWQERVDHLYFNSLRPPVLRRTVNKAAKSVRRAQPPMLLFGGSQWVCIDAAFARHVVLTLGSPTAFSRFLRFTHTPDEMAIQTVALNGPFASAVVDDNLRHIRWKPGAAHPDVFNEADFDELIASKKLFARKFDLSAHPRLLDRLDSQALHLKERYGGR